MTPAERARELVKCNWCGRGPEWSAKWEFVNGKRWYHAECIALMDCVS